MKSFLFILFLISYLISSVLIGNIPSGMFDKYIKYNVLFNHGKSDVALYPEKANSSIVQGYLKPGKGINFEYGGAKEQWMYGRYNGRIVSIRDGGVIKANIVAGVPIEQRNLRLIQQYSSYALVIFVLIFIFGKKKTKSQFSDKEKNNYIEKIQQLIYKVSSLEKENNRKEGVIQRLQQELAEQKRRLLNKKQEWDGLLEKHAQEESRVRNYQVEISDLKESLDLLQSKFNKVIEEAKIFDYPYENKNYKNLLKGRKYELRVAESFCLMGYTILEWTPDKGFDQNMYVESNSNPDLVLKKGDDILAVECKYRSKFFRMDIAKYQYDDEISWATQYSVDRYHQFSLKRDIPVFIALSFQGEPESPDNEYFIPFNEALESSEDRKWYKKDKQTGKVKFNQQKIMRHSDMLDFAVRNSNYMSLALLSAN